MQAVFEKIIEKLEEKHEQYINTYGIVGGNPSAFAVKECIDTVRKIAEQYKGGWVPCSEKLPELRKDVLVTVKYTGFMGMHGYWIQTGHMEAENDWWGDCAGGEVIAWMELPSAYRPKEK